MIFPFWLHFFAYLEISHDLTYKDLVAIFDGAKSMVKGQSKIVGTGERNNAAGKAAARGAVDLDGVLLVDHFIMGTFLDAS